MVEWVRSWWVVLFCIAISAVHLHFLKLQKEGIQTQKERLMSMQREKLAAIALRDDLKERIASQSDPAWIEMVLMRDLGVVPEGFLKVHFKR
jgi:hypothetical protein